MDKVKQWVVLTLVGVLGVLAAGWMLLVSPTRAEAAELRAQADLQVQANEQLEDQLAVLAAQAEDLPAQQAALAALAERIPASAAQPALLRALAAAAADADLQLISVAPGPLAPVVATAAAAGTAQSPPAAGTGSALLGMPLTIQVAGSYVQVEQYVALLENLPRALRISTLTLTPGADPTAPTAPTAPATPAAPAVEDGDSLVADIEATVFVAPADVAAPDAPAAVANAPAAD